MRLYSGTTRSLNEDATHNRIAGKLSESFFYHLGRHPGPSEVASWKNSLRAVSQVFTTADLMHQGVLLEMQLPNNARRLDCLVRTTKRLESHRVLRKFENRKFMVDRHCPIRESTGCRDLNPGPPVALAGNRR